MTLFDAVPYVPLSPVKAQTQKDYEITQHEFIGFARERNLDTLPANLYTFLAYFEYAASNCTPQHLRKKLTAVRRWYHAQGEPEPTHTPAFRNAFRKIQVRYCMNPAFRGAWRFITLPQLRSIIDHIGDDMRGARDRALLLLTFCGALHGEELSSLCVGDIYWGDEHGITLTARMRDHTRKVSISSFADVAYCPVVSLQKWLAMGRIHDGPVFCSIRFRPSGNRVRSASFRDIVRKRMEAAGINPDGYGIGSFRLGFIVRALQCGIADQLVARQAGIEHPVTIQSWKNRISPLKSTQMLFD